MLQSIENISQLKPSLDLLWKYNTHSNLRAEQMFSDQTKLQNFFSIVPAQTKKHSFKKVQENYRDKFLRYFGIRPTKKTTTLKA